MSDCTFTCVLSSAERTCEFARALAPRLGPGDVILMSGDVGAGKTHFARCLIQSLLDVPEDVPSPTYTLVQTYPTPRVEIWHVDLYRISGPSEIIELGLTEAFETAICLVEWPDRLGDLSPVTALDLDLSMADGQDARQLCLRWSDPRWASLLKGLCDE